MKRFNHSLPIASAMLPTRGFALIVTLSLMILLTVIAVGLLSLSSLSLRASGQSAAQSEAQANARLALMLALGELQQSLGPDQNITAPSAIFDTDPDTAVDEGLNHRHLTGVWQARGEALSQTPDYSRSASFRRWLVSNTNDVQLKLPEFVRQGSLINPVPMVDVSKNPSDVRVEAGRLTVGCGSLAWWVGDENCKAFINPRDDADRKSNAQTAELIAGFAAPGAHGVLTLDGFGNFPTYRCEPRAVHSGHPARMQNQMFSSQIAWRHEAANPRVAFISENYFPSTTLQNLNNNPQPFLHLDIRLKTLNEPALPNKTWLHTFIIRGYGEARSADGGQITARAWCEAVVQRVPDYLDATDPPEVARLPRRERGQAD